MKPSEYYVERLSQASKEKDRDADQLDQWARESRSGGWSTHQVEPMTRKADVLRREASELRRVIRTVVISETGTETRGVS